jgi:hypothetical protein
MVHEVLYCYMSVLVAEMVHVNETGVI